MASKYLAGEHVDVGSEIAVVVDAPAGGTINNMTKTWAYTPENGVQQYRTADMTRLYTWTWLIGKTFDGATVLGVTGYKVHYDDNGVVMQEHVSDFLATRL